MNGDSLTVKPRDPVRIDERQAFAACWFVKDGAALNLGSSQAAAQREVGLARGQGPADSLLSLNWSAVGAVAERESGLFRLFSKAIAETVADVERQWPAPSN